MTIGFNDTFANPQGCHIILYLQKQDIFQFLSIDTAKRARGRVGDDGRSRDRQWGTAGRLQFGAP